jgi:hypothetical protein
MTEIGPGGYRIAITMQRRRTLMFVMGCSMT